MRSEQVTGSTQWPGGGYFGHTAVRTVLSGGRRSSLFGYSPSRKVRFWLGVSGNGSDGSGSSFGSWNQDVGKGGLSLRG